jgi:hypothetical protein
VRLLLATLAVVLPGTLVHADDVLSNVARRVERARAASRTGAYDNALIAETALRYVGRWGGEACRDAGKLDNGNTGRTVGGYGAGQCRTFVNCILWLVSGGTQYPTGTYFQSFFDAGGKEVKKESDLAKGDIVQWGNGLHTYIIVGHLHDDVFNVVDSNSDGKSEIVAGPHQRKVALSANQRAFRMGRISAPARAAEEHGLGPVRAYLYYTQIDSYSYSHPRIQIVRSGHVMVKEAVPPYRPGYNTTVEPAWPANASWTKRHSLTVRDFDANGEPEVMVELTWGGAHHATWSRVYRYDRANGRYLGSVRFWGDQSFRLEQLNRDPRPEWLSRDPRFQGRFACEACSGIPLQIWTYRAGRWQDITRSFPARITTDATRWWRAYLSERGKSTANAGENTRGRLAAWAADEELLGRHRQVVTALGQARRRGDLALEGISADVLGSPSTYIQQLLRFLRKTGYIRG